MTKIPDLARFFEKYFFRRIRTTIIDNIKKAPATKADALINSIRFWNDYKTIWNDLRVIVSTFNVKHEKITFYGRFLLTTIRS